MIAPETDPNAKIMLTPAQHEAAVMAMWGAADAGSTGTVSLPGRRGGDFVADFTTPGTQATAEVMRAHNFNSFSGTAADGREVSVDLVRRNAVARALTRMTGRNLLYKAEVSYKDAHKVKFFGSSNI